MIPNPKGEGTTTGKGDTSLKEVGNTWRAAGQRSLLGFNISYTKVDTASIILLINKSLCKQTDGDLPTYIHDLNEGRGFS